MNAKDTPLVVRAVFDPALVCNIRPTMLSAVTDADAWSTI